jgi:hypothetical protein
MLENYSTYSWPIIAEFIAIIQCRKRGLWAPKRWAQVQAAAKTLEQDMTQMSVGEAAKAVVRRNTEEVQGGGNFEAFEELFADDIRRSRDARPTRQARVNFIMFCVPPFRTSTPTSTGNLPMVTG